MVAQKASADSNADTAVKVLSEVVAPQFQIISSIDDYVDSQSQMKDDSGSYRSCGSYGNGSGSSSCGSGGSSGGSSSGSSGGGSSSHSCGCFSSGVSSRGGGGGSSSDISGSNCGSSNSGGNGGICSFDGSDFSDVGHR